MRVCAFAGAALWIRAERPARGWPGFRASTATHLAHGRSHGWTTCRALSVRRNLRYGGLQCLAEDEGVPAPERPTSRHRGQRRISSLARNGAAHRGDGRDPAVPRALFPRPQPHQAGLRRSEEAPGVSGAGHPRRYRQDLSTIVDLAIATATNKTRLDFHGLDRSDSRSSTAPGAVRHTHE